MAEYLSKEDINTGEYISRDEALRALHQYCTDCAISCDGVMCRACDHANAMDIISDMPAADVQPVIHAAWIDTTPNDFYEWYKCSNCKYTDTKNYSAFSNASQLVRFDGNSFYLKLTPGNLSITGKNLLVWCDEGLILGVNNFDTLAINNVLYLTLNS